MRIIEGPNGDDSRTAFLIAPDLPRHSVEPKRLHTAAWCSLVLSIGWALTIVVLAVAAVGGTFSDIDTDTVPAAGVVVLLLVPFYGVVFSMRLVRSSDDVAAFVALWPLHILAIPVNLVGAFDTIYFVPSLVLNAATLLGFWWEKRWWDRF